VRRYRIIFMGSPEFALPALEAVSSQSLLAVVTRPDRPSGRGLKLSPSAVKEWALQKGIKIFQPERLKGDSVIEELRALNPDFIIVASYGKILPPEILKITQYFCINVHPSLLPKYRGAAPVPWTLINGETETGVTIFEMNDEMDAGDILVQKKTSIDPEEDAGTLLKRLAVLGAAALHETIERFGRNEIIAKVEQVHSRATYAPKLKKEDGLINWDMSAPEIHNRIRGLNPWPGAYTFREGRILKIWRSGVVGDSSDKPPGTIVDVQKNGIYVQTGRDILKIGELQLEGGRRISCSDFIAGHKIEMLIKLGMDTGRKND